MLETYYVDGPVIFTTHNLKQLLSRLQTYFALQYVVRITYIRNIEDHELLLYLIMTDKLDFRSKDSFDNKFKLFLNYEETVTFCDQVNQIVQPIVNSLYAGQPTNQYSILVKNRNLIFQGFIASNGQPMIELTMMTHNDGNHIAKTYMRLSKFQEFVAAVNSIIRNWHNTLTNAYYQFDKLGKALVHIHKDLLQKLSKLEEKISQLQNQSCNTVITYDNDNISKEPTVTNDDDINETTKIANNSIKYEEPIPTSDNEPKASNVSDYVMEQLNNIVKKQIQKSEVTEDLLPIEYIDDIKALKPYFNKFSISELVNKYKEPLKKLLVNYGVPEMMLENDSELLKVLMDIKTLLEGKPVNSMIGLMIQQALQEVG